MSNFIFNKSNCFCISLLSNNERWLKMEKKFEIIGLDVNRVPAAIGGTDDIIDSFNNNLNNGQIGCAQSHVNLWKYIYNNKLPYALILEDDACFDKDWKSKLDNFFKDINDPHWDLILLNSSEPCHPIHEWNLCREQYLAGGYIISFRGVKNILNLFNNYYYSSDWMTSRLQLYNHSYCYFPWLIIQEGNESTIGSCFEEDHNKVIRCLNEINYGLDNYIIY
jgi:GR25 family glycosyltransferase involved in LPS biosynthesis